MITDPPQSWMQLCVEKGLCDKEADTLSCLHNAVSQGFKYEELKTLVQLFVDHDFLTASEGDSFMADIPLGPQTDEEDAEVTDTLLADPSNEYSSLLPNVKQNLKSFAGTFTPSQEAAFQWLTSKLDSGDTLSSNCRPCWNWQIIHPKSCSCTLQKEWPSDRKACTQWYSCPFDRRSYCSSFLQP